MRGPMKSRPSVERVTGVDVDARVQQFRQSVGVSDGRRLTEVFLQNRGGDRWRRHRGDEYTKIAKSRARSILVFAMNLSPNRVS